MLYLQMEDVERGVIVVREDTNHGNCGSRIKAVA